MYKKVITLAIVFVLAAKMIVTYDSAFAKDNLDTTIEDIETNDSKSTDDSNSIDINSKKEEVIVSEEEKNENGTVVSASEDVEYNLSKKSNKTNEIMLTVPSTGSVILNDEKGRSFSIKKVDNSRLENGKSVEVSLKSKNGWNLVFKSDKHINKIGYNLVLLDNGLNKKENCFTEEPSFINSNEIHYEYKTAKNKNDKVNKDYVYRVKNNTLNKKGEVAINYKAVSKSEDFISPNLEEGCYKDKISFSWVIN